MTSINAEEKNDELKNFSNDTQIKDFAIDSTAQESVTERSPNRLNLSLPNNPSRSGKLRTIGIISCAVLISVIIAAAVFFNFYTTVGSFSDFRIFSVAATKIDLTQNQPETISGIERCKNLKSLRVKNISANDLEYLKKCGRLNELIVLNENFTEEQAKGLSDFAKTFSDCDIILNVKLGEDIYDNQIKSLTLNNDIDDESVYLFALFSDLEYLDISECEISDAGFKQICDMFPDCNVKYEVTIGEKEYDTLSVTEIKFGSDVSDELDKLTYFFNLKKVDATACTNYDKLLEVAKMLNGCDIFWKININGFELFSNAKKIDISGKKIKDESEIDKLRYFTDLEYADMCQCGLSNAKMEELGKKYPNVKFVWLLTLGKGAWHLRTDAVAFSTLNMNDMVNEYDEEMYSPIFKYCTDLIALDLGHNQITSIEGIQNLKKLRVLILTDNKITDLSPLEELTELEFIELNVSNDVKSLEPLRNLNKLKILNLYRNDNIEDFSPLCNKPELIYVIFPEKMEKSKENQAQVEAIKATAHPEFKASYQSGFYSEDGIFHGVTYEYGTLKYRVGLKKAFAQWWEVRDPDVGENWENLKFDENFKNTGLRYYFNSRYQKRTPEYYYEGTPEYFENMEKNGQSN